MHRYFYPLLVTVLPYTVLSCAPGLKEQQSLALRVQAAAKDCKADVKRCVAAAKCAERAQVAEKAIQSAQEARSHGKATPEQETEVAGSYVAADSFCKKGGW